ncbi:hypothetical protein DK846_03605 [Methanospirillum lacunae]|uniref:Uncharacterized protein n=1 Tax=Methanospirillum lacunae TaxID=668570 RepID=A0A2V2N9B6_9EURY|nr:hypothetical protein DK846_03605 [Methanospirillum lacunae]
MIFLSENLLLVVSRYNLYLNQSIIFRFYYLKGSDFYQKSLLYPGSIHQYLITGLSLKQDTAYPYKPVP